MFGGYSRFTRSAFPRGKSRFDITLFRTPSLLLSSPSQVTRSDDVSTPKDGVRFIFTSTRAYHQHLSILYLTRQVKKSRLQKPCIRTI
jgi:hypothetical protein